TRRYGQPRNPVTAAAAPAQPAQRYPTITVTLRTLGPGRSCPSAKRSTNSCSVSQCWRSTSTRRAQNTMPPKPDRVIWEKVRNRVHAVTWGPCAAGTPLDSGDVDIMFLSLRSILGQQSLSAARVAAGNGRQLSYSLRSPSADAVAGGHGQPDGDLQ